MLYVVFTKLDHTKIQKFEKIPFDKAVELSHELEMEMREQKQKISGDFHVLNNEDDVEEIYSGAFVFGSYFAPNLFIHIKKNLQKIRTGSDKEKANKKLSFIQKMEESISETYKQEENIDEEMYRNIDKEKISYLKKWQRYLIYGVGLFFAVAFFGLLAFFLIQISSINADYQSIENQLAAEQKANEYYADAVLDNNSELEKYLSQKDSKELTEKEREIYGVYLANDDEYEKLVQLFDEEPKIVVNFLANNGKTDKIKEFNDLYPTKEAEFEMAYAEDNYDKVIELDNYDKTKDRSIKRTDALLEQGKTDKAKRELENNEDEELAERIKEQEKENDDD